MNIEYPTEKITFDNFPSTIEKMYREIIEIKMILKDVMENFEPKQPTEYLTRNEVAALLKCNIGTVHNWTVTGKLKPFGIGNRVYYKRVEVEGALIAFRGGN